MAPAERGFAALALNYVAYPVTGGLPGVPATFTNLPVEILDQARSWLAGRPEADAARIGLVGSSKGAELALVGASRLGWVKATVACVPSDLVWAGYGRAPAPGELLSSWSFEGKPLPFIAYDRYEEVFSGRVTAAQVHVRSRAAAPPAAIAAARIPVDRIVGPVLLLGGGRDEVWPSLAMSRNIQAAYRGSGRGILIEVGEYPEAGHTICGTGATPGRADGNDGAATARASGAAFERTLAFLRNRLAGPRNGR
jgi:dienelactone hydrolase